MSCVAAHPYHSGQFGGDAGEPLRPGGQDLTRRAIQCAGFAAGQQVLDLGCGEAGGTKLLRRRGCAAIGLDASTTSLVGVATRLPDLPLVAASAEQLPFADGSLDGILAECSLSLTGFSPAALAECQRVLRPGGQLAVTDVFARAKGGSGAALPACLATLSERDDILARLVDAGFQVGRWEDHSAVLKTFMARLIFETGSADSLWAGNSATLNASLRQSRPGYFLLIAGKARREA